MREIISGLWEVLESFQDFLSALILSLLTAAVLAAFRPRVKLTWGSTSLSHHSFKVREDGEPISVSTEKLYVQNIGRRAAYDVELILSAKPTSYTLWQPRDHQAKSLSNGAFSILVPSLAPKELLIIDMIDIDLLQPKLIGVNCPDTIAEEVSFLAQRQFGAVMNAIVFYLMFAGLVGTLYFAIALFFR